MYDDVKAMNDCCQDMTARLKVTDCLLNETNESAIVQ